MEQARSGGEVVKAVEPSGVGAFGRDLALGAVRKKSVAGPPRVTLTSIKRSLPAGSKLRMSYPAPSPSSWDVHSILRARSGRAQATRETRSW